MRKCDANELLVPVVSLALQCAKGVQYNWAQYLCHEFLSTTKRPKKRERCSTMRGCCFLSHWWHGRRSKKASSLSSI